MIFILLAFIYSFYPTPYNMSPIILFSICLYVLYMDCITLTCRFRICWPNFCLQSSITKDCWHAILKFIDVLSVFLRVPLYVTSKWEQEVSMNYFSPYLSPVTGVILKTGNPLSGCPSTWYTVSSKQSWILFLPLKAVLLRRTFIIIQSYLGASYFKIILSHMFLIFLFYDMLGCFVSSFQSFT